MSRLPTLSTPGRPVNGSPMGSGIPTPASRRPRSSLGPTQPKQSDAEMDQALKDLLRRRPPSSLGRDDPDTPTQVPSSYMAPERSMQTPRTPGLRPKTPSSLATPTSRPTSRPSLVGRPSLSSSTTTPRRPSMAASTSTTPAYRRPESRAGTYDPKWAPAVGDRVRLPQHGYEGTLRYLGETHNREGTWAGVELEGGFRGKGRNDGSVDGHKYFECPPNCGIFTLAEKLAPPTSAPTGPSRPASVASHRSLASSYSASGRATPSQERMRRGAATPNQGRTATARAKAEEDAGNQTLLGNSNATNVARAEARVTAGSRASKYLGMTAKQLDARQAGTSLTSSTSTLHSSTATTPKASRIGMTGATPSRTGRPSIGGAMVTPKARGPRMSEMPPPPSPQQPKTTNVSPLQEELRELRRVNAELEERLASHDQAKDESNDAQARVEELAAEVKKAKEEAEALRSQLTTSNGDADTDRQRAAELQVSGGKLQEDLDAKIKELEELKKEMQVAEERAQGELEAGMEAKREEVRKEQERAEAAENEAAELKRLVDQLTLAGNQIIELNESKQYTFECQIRELEDKLAKNDEEVKEAKRLSAVPAVGGASSKPVTAAEIDNETLNAQVKHLQNRIISLEEQLDEAHSQAETDSDAWKEKYNKTTGDKKDLVDELERMKDEVASLKKEGVAANTRNAELQAALKENQAALEVARAEIETLRGEATEAESMRAGGASEEHETRISELQSKLNKLQGSDVRATELEAQVALLESEVANLKNKHDSAVGDGPDEGTPRSMSRRPRTSTGSMEEAEKSIRGYHHIINEMKAENSQLKNKQADLEEEISMLKEEVKLLQDINETEDSPAALPTEELKKLRATNSAQETAIKEYEREVSELESLIESKIYHEDELETRLADLERDLERYRSKTAASVVVPVPSSHSRTPSITSIASSLGDAPGSDIRCELCEGPHDLDACPVFSGSAFQGGAANGGGSGGTSPLSVKKKKWCAECQSAAHNTAECPMEDTF